MSDFVELLRKRRMEASGTPDSKPKNAAPAARAETKSPAGKVVTFDSPAPEQAFGHTLKEKLSEARRAAATERPLKVESPLVANPPPPTSAESPIVVVDVPVVEAWGTVDVLDDGDPAAERHGAAAALQLAETAEKPERTPPRTITAELQQEMVVAAVRGTLDKAAGPLEERLCASAAECRKLLDLFPDGTVTIGVGDGQSRVRAEHRTPVREAQMLALMELCPNGHTVIRNTRLTFEDWRAYLVEFGDDDDPNGINLLPMTGDDARSFRRHLIEANKPTAANRVARSLEAAQKDLKLDVPLLSPIVVPPGETGAKVRWAPPPIAVKLLEEAACNPSDMFTDPQIDHIRSTCVNMYFNGRGGDHRASRYEDAASTASISRVCRIDKLGRAEVTQYAPRMGITTPSPEWIDAYVSKYESAECTAADFVSDEGDRVYDLELAARAVYDVDGKPAYCPRRKALGAMSTVTRMVTQKTKAFLAERHMTGTHPYRHIGAITTERAEWPVTESCVIGDWAPPKDEPAAKRPRATKACTVRNYSAYASKPRQLGIRKRYIGMLQAAFAAYDKPITWETTWDDLLPKSPSDSHLRAFYGSIKDHTDFSESSVPDT